MTVEARREAAAPEWSEWQNAVIKELYPLRRVLHGSDRSAIFLTEAGPQGAGAAIKIVRTDQTTSGLQLQRWRAAAALSHPHLVRLLDFGLCQLEGHSFVYLVMEHAEQTLAELLPKRALSAEEAREMLRPTLEVLSFLHGRNLVHGQLSPAALLVVNDQLKLASHCIRAAGEPRLGGGKPSLYDPPEADGGRLQPPGDVWGLGVTLVEALTQSLPWLDAQAGSATLPSLPTEFAALVRRCLRHNPGSRPAAAELHAQLNGAAATPLPPTAMSPAPSSPAPASARPTSPASAGPAAASRASTRPAPSRPASAKPAPANPPPLPPSRPAPARETAKVRATEAAASAMQPPVTAIAAAMLIAVMVIAWGGWRLFRGNATAAPAAATVETASPPVVSAPVAAPGPSPTTQAAPTASVHPNKASAAAVASDASVVHAQIPAVSRSAQRTIRGHIKVAVLVTVDRLGNVVAAMLEYAGPSPYFARVAREAARKWQFAPAAQQDSRKWLVKFEFSRDGTTGHASPSS